MTLPVTVVVPHLSSRDEWFNRFCWPSIKANDPAEIFVIKDVSPASRARNEGLAKVKTPFVLFVDDDHIMGSDCIAQMVEALERSPGASFAYCQYIGLDLKAPKVIPMLSQPFNVTDLENGNYIDVSSLLRRADCPKFDEQVQGLEDWDLWLQMTRAGKKGVFIPKVLFYKFVIDKSISAKLASGEIDKRYFLKKWGKR